MVIEQYLSQWIIDLITYGILVSIVMISFCLAIYKSTKGKEKMTKNYGLEWYYESVEKLNYWLVYTSIFFILWVVLVVIL